MPIKYRCCLYKKLKDDSCSGNNPFFEVWDMYGERKAYEPSRIPGHTLAASFEADTKEEVYPQLDDYLRSEGIEPPVRTEEVAA
jgi:hypothetical protein